MTTNRQRMGHAKTNTSTATAKSAFSPMDHLGSFARHVWNLWLSLFHAFSGSTDRAVESVVSTEAASLYVSDHAGVVARIAEASVHGESSYDASGYDQRKGDRDAHGGPECYFMGSYGESSSLWLDSGI